MKTRILLAVGFLFGIVTSVNAMEMTVTEILYQSDVVDPSVLSGTVDMTLSGSVLTITLVNTSSGVAGPAAGNLLTGVGFNLPTGVTIASGSALMGTSDAINFTKPLGGDVSQEWGYDNNPLQSGAFKDLATTPLNTAVSAMVSQTETQFASGSLDGAPPGLAGPDFGLLSANVSGSILGTGLEGIQDTLTITLNLSGTIPGNLLSYIEANGIALSFGSPDLTTLPEPGTLALFGAGLAALGAIRRRRKKLTPA